MAARKQKDGWGWGQKITNNKKNKNNQTPSTVIVFFDKTSLLPTNDTKLCWASSMHRGPTGAKDAQWPESRSPVICRHALLKERKYPDFSSCSTHSPSWWNRHWPASCVLGGLLGALGCPLGRPLSGWHSGDSAPAADRLRLQQPKRERAGGRDGSGAGAAVSAAANQKTRLPR